MAAGDFHRFVEGSITRVRQRTVALSWGSGPPFCRSPLFPGVNEEFCYGRRDVLNNEFLKLFCEPGR
ncbi:MAG: hypothetical protein AVDCRST_MAG91-2101 [uncultured Sphingomonadaceae bacterium]|uniref:Uncharacterized protein n=1 Tax=uncultured Sphingomonadaceae bacterium TaxID=169976 RepID=A0A6J4TBF3_9SPHN|nr:MAG: hypothetical protein AVDCRST_MAG91-2101 [uncultured Sphingomonadaceae bacterium]